MVTADSLLSIVSTYYVPAACEILASVLILTTNGTLRQVPKNNINIKHVTRLKKLARLSLMTKSSEIHRVYSALLVHMQHI